ncbi:MAG: biosynthetic-type acetolactate synthase large subunit [Mariprofundales bacterium]
MKLTGAQIFVECLKREGVDIIFGYPGGAVLTIYDEIFKQNHFRHVLVRHEQAALHAANGYARVSGRCGVAIVTSGPGATNAVTGLADSYADSIPTVCFSGQVPTNMIGNDAFQEADTVGITRSATKHNFLVKHVEDLAKTIRQAFHIATTGRPGPVLVDIPKDITNDSCLFEYPESVEIRSYKPVTHGHPGQVRRAAKMLLEAKQPLIYSGGGAISSEGGATQLGALATLLNLPVTNTLMGLGAIPCSDPRFLGMLGMHGTYEANMAVSNCDLLIAVGARFDDRVTGRLDGFAPHAKVIHIDVDPSSISKNVHAHLPIVGDVAIVLKQLIDELLRRECKADSAALPAWWSQIAQWRERDSLHYEQPTDAKIKPQEVIRRLHAATKGDAVVVTDVGQHQMWAAQHYGFHNARRFLTSGGLGTMGYGLPAALGAQMAAPDSRTIVITGDGSIQMCSQELATAFQYQLPITVVILNNGYLGMVRQWQEMFYQQRYSHSYFDALPNFAKLAEAYGGIGIKVEKLNQLDDAIRRAMHERERFMVLDITVEGRENVYPMVPAGAALDEMVLAP